VSPKSLIRYEQVRRRGAQPDVQGTDASFAEGRYFDANCLASDAINQFVRVTGNTLGLPNVTKVDPSDSTKMPAVGVIVQKATATTCLVQVLGQITSFSPVVAGTWYYVAPTAFPSSVPPALPAISQVIGVGLGTTRLLLRPDLGVGSQSRAIDGEVPSGSIDGVNLVFGTVFPFRVGTTRLYLNGVRQRIGIAYDYIEGPGPQTLTQTLAPRAEDTLLVDYLF